MNMSMWKRDEDWRAGEQGGRGLGMLHFPNYRHVDDGHKVAAAASSLSLSAKQDKVTDASSSRENLKRNNSKLIPICTTSYKPVKGGFTSAGVPANLKEWISWYPNCIITNIKIDISWVSNKLSQGGTASY